MEDLIEQGYIPLDKSWIIRMGVLDLVDGYRDCIDYLTLNDKELGDDLRSLCLASNQWNNNKPVEVGESGTLYRFLKFASWKFGLDKEFKLEGSLIERAKKMCNDPEIVNYSLDELLKLDNKTS